MGKKDAGVKIPVLDKDNYFHWKVRMHLHLLSIDESYVNCIQKGPHVPMKVCTSIGADGEDMVGKMIPNLSMNTLKKILKKCTRIRKP